MELQEIEKKLKEIKIGDIITEEMQGLLFTYMNKTDNLIKQLTDELEKQTTQLNKMTDQLNKMTEII